MNSKKHKFINFLKARRIGWCSNDKQYQKRFRNCKKLFQKTAKLCQKLKGLTFYGTRC